MYWSKAVKIFVSLIITEVRLLIHSCHTTYPSAAVVAGETLYFTGGAYTFRGDRTQRPGTYHAPFIRLEGLLTGCPISGPFLYSLPLNNSFPVDGPVPASSYYVTGSPKQWINEGVFFQDAEETMLYNFGGYEDKKQQPINTLNTYNITSGEWSNVTVSGGDFNYAGRASTSHAISQGTPEALGFVSGGWDDLGGMVRFDASDPANPQWRNETENNTPLTLEGSMEFIRLGPKGSLINFGGYNKDYVNPELTGWSYDLRSFAQINVYDIDSATWFNVTASGDVPSKRSAFCSVVSSAPDDTSFQITIYGGWDLFGARSFADTYVLSIPAFHWIDVTDNFHPDARLSTGNDFSGRDHHRCIAHKERQMLVLGGILRIERETQNSGGCSRDLPALRALDLTTFEWSDRWNGSPEPYSVPDAVTRIIGGNGEGGATMTQPNGGFDNSALNSIFATVAPRYTPIAARQSGSQPGPGSNNSSDEPPSNPNGTNRPARRTSIGSIVGWVIGGVAILALTVAIAFLLLRRRKRAAQPSPPHERAWDGRPQELSNDTQKTGGYYNPSEMAAGSYQPVTQEMDADYRGGSHVVGEARKPAVSELPG